MCRRLRTGSLLFAITLLVAGCSGRLAVQSDSSQTVLEVVNRATLDMTIYAVTDAGGRQRLGTAGSLTTTRLTIPQRLVAPAASIRFQADPVGSAQTHFSDQIPVSPGDVVVLEIPPE